MAKGDDLIVRSDQLMPRPRGRGAFGARGDSALQSHPPQPPLALPDRKRSTLTVLPLPQDFVEGETRQRVVRITCAGAPIFTDRKYTILTFPPELDGSPGIAFSANEVRRSARLTFTAKKPVRVFIAFGPRNPDDLWLDPQPGWKVFKEDSFTCTDRYVGKDVYYRDFPAGPVDLFAAEKGTYIVLGIVAKPQK